MYKKFYIAGLLLCLPGVVYGYTDVAPLDLPTLGTPAEVTDAIQTVDSSASEGLRLTQLKFNATATNCLTGTATWAAFQAYDADLTTYAGITPGAFVQTFLDDADEATFKATVNLEAGTDFNAYDADLDTYAGITPSAFVQSILDDADQATFQATLKALMPVTQAATVATGAALTPTAGYRAVDIALTCDGAFTMAETGAIENAIVRVTNVSANTCTIANAANNFVHKGGGTTTLTLVPEDSFIAQFQTDQWTVLVNNTSTQYFSYLQVPTKTLDPIVADPDAAAMSTYNLFGQRFIASAAGTYDHTGPAVIAGENWAIESQFAGEVILTIDGADTIMLNGVSCGAGKGLDTDGSVDAFVACQYQAANTYACRGTSWNCTP